MNSVRTKSVVVIVAHPDDETLWAGGTILSNPTWKWFIVCLCRKSDKERATKFYKALKILNSDGIMGDLDDEPDQKPLNEELVERTILNLLPHQHFDLIITHHPSGEYTRHRRHEEINKAVSILWNDGRISANELWVFAYEDGNKKYFPQAVESATSCHQLTKHIWQKKYSIITETFGFEKDSWEAETTPRSEAFWQFKDPQAVRKFNQCANLAIG